MHQVLRRRTQGAAAQTGARNMADKSFAEIIEDATEDARNMDAPVSVRLQRVADEVRQLSPAFADIVARMISRLADNGVGHGAN